jgi:sugar phosphate permease
VPSSPAPPRAGTTFSGWRIVVLSAVVLGLSGPGQTAGVSVFIDPMIEELGLTRGTLSTAYLVGTLAGALAMPRVGRMIDHSGIRTTLTYVAGAFGLVLAAMAGVTGVVTLVVGFAGIRMLGQGGVSLIATTAPAPWFERRLGTAIGVATAVGGALISLVPVLSAFLIGRIGWRFTWVVLGALVWVVLLPIARRGLIDRPGDVGQHVDGLDEDGRAAAVAADVVPRPVAPNLTRREALRTPMFWAITGAVVATAMIATGLGFHQVDLLGEQGLTPLEAAANFLPQTAAGLVVTLAVGAMVDRVAPRWVLTTSMLLLAAAMVGVQAVSPGISAVLYGMAIGAAGASVRTLEGAAFPQLFGLAALGEIRGTVHSLAVASTAFGPLALSLGRDLTGSYIPVLQWLLVIPAGVVVLALVAPDPRRTAPSTTDGDRHDAPAG